MPHQVADCSEDHLATIVEPDIQRVAARMAQDAFAETFRLTLNSSDPAFDAALNLLKARCQYWCNAASTHEAKILRLVLLISGIDQWGLAYSQTFELNSIPGASLLIGKLRTQLDPKEEALFLRFFDQVADIEADAIDFKVELRRNIHLALWHAMIACDAPEESQAIMTNLGSLMVALNTKMPNLGWRLLADALASIQISLLGDAVAASKLAQESTQQLFSALRQTLPKAQFRSILAYSGQAVLSWLQSRRPAN
ncbi:MAG: hypothetical protein PHV02_07715 [Rhodocyclaceae bacterium]|nr:hypothetical protein [Rhodocyclaceae bacterium]